MTLIGLYSPVPQSGKSTFANTLLDLKEGSRVVKFADGFRELLVDVLADFFEGGSAEVHEWLADKRKDTALIPELGVTLRHCLQTLGIWGRVSVQPDLWVRKARKAIMRAHNAPLVVVDDLRFPNEYWMLRELNATIIRIERPAAPITERHQSNGQLEDFSFDYRVTNDCCPTELALRAKHIAWEVAL